MTIVVDVVKKGVKLEIIIALLVFILTSTSALAVCTDSDSDGVGVCPNCGTPQGCTYDGDDCNDNDANIHPPRDDFELAADTTLCNGTYYVNDGKGE